MLSFYNCHIDLFKQVTSVYYCEPFSFVLFLFIYIYVYNMVLIRIIAIVDLFFYLEDKGENLA